jgi:hypothetical protein
LTTARWPEDYVTPFLALHERMFLVSVGAVQRASDEPCGVDAATPSLFRWVVVEELVPTATLPPPRDEVEGAMRRSSYQGHFITLVFRADPELSAIELFEGDVV